MFTKNQLILGVPMICTALVGIGMIVPDPIKIIVLIGVFISGIEVGCLIYHFQKKLR